MNEHKFCFIICTNNDLMLDECIHYINHLSIPEGYTTELLTIRDAPSMTAGYQEAMEASDAKYKIYMHQDVFLLNHNLLTNLLSIFQSDTAIGMVGMVGYEAISPDGMMWMQPRIGSLYPRKAPSSLFPPLSEYRYSLSHDGFSRAAIIDGMFMATSTDLSWDTNRLKHFDFYDVFQSIRFLEHGYQIVVPKQLHPWCLHDDNLILNLEHYNNYRKLFLQSYPEYPGKRFDEIPMRHQTKAPV